MNSGSDGDRQPGEDDRELTRLAEGIGIEQTVPPEEISTGGETAYLQQLKATHRARARAATR